MTVYYSTQVIDTPRLLQAILSETNVGGSSAIPNLGNAGITIGNLARNTRIGTNADGLFDTTERNIIFGNLEEGIQIEGSATNTIVAGNFVGSDAHGGFGPWQRIFRSLLRNPGLGQCNQHAYRGTNAVEGNVLAFNTSSGLAMRDAAPANSSLVRNNSFRQNARIGIDLGAVGATPMIPRHR